MLGLDERIAGLGEGGLAVALVVAVLLGLRHATDPDHLTAVSMLVLDGDRRGARSAGALGLAWGLGHALTLVALGLPLVVAGHLLPEAVQSAAELAVGAAIALLAIRLLVRWRRGYFHSHEHSHGDRTHAHPHFHEHAPAGERAHARSHAHGHAHAGARERRPLAAFGVGVLHGAGGSAATGLLLVSAMPSEAVAAVALGLLATGTAASMAVASAAFGGVLGGPWTRRRIESLVPVLAACSLAFGAWYGLGALRAVPHVL